MLCWAIGGCKGKRMGSTHFLFITTFFEFQHFFKNENIIFLSHIQIGLAPAGMPTSHHQEFPHATNICTFLFFEIIISQPNVFHYSFICIFRHSTNSLPFPPPNQDHNHNHHKNKKPKSLLKKHGPAKVHMSRHESIQSRSNLKIIKS